VNAGVGEVAKVFLTIGSSSSSSSSSSSGARDRTSSDWHSKKSDESTTTTTTTPAAISPSESKAIEDNNELTVKLKVRMQA